MFPQQVTMQKRYQKKKEQQKKIALQRILRLSCLAENYALQHRFHLSNRYVYLARKISMRYLVSIPPSFKRRFCKHCYCFLLPSVNCRVRISNKYIVTYCLHCKKHMRIPLKKG